MAIEPGLMLPKIKASIRIKHTALDDDIEDTIRAALDDLTVCGVVVPNVGESGEIDPLILNAVKLFCKVEYTDDTAKAAEFQRRYDSMKACMMMSEKYREVTPVE